MDSKEYQEEMDKAVLRAVYLCTMSCADGDGLVLSPRWKELADKFNAYENSNNEFHRWDDDVQNDVRIALFGKQQECVIFCETRDVIPSWRGSDITVKMP